MHAGKAAVGTRAGLRNTTAIQSFMSYGLGETHRMFQSPPFLTGVGTSATQAGKEFPLPIAISAQCTYAAAVLVAFGCRCIFSVFSMQRGWGWRSAEFGQGMRSNLRGIHERSVCIWKSHLPLISPMSHMHGAICRLLTYDGALVG